MHSTANYAQALIMKQTLLLLVFVLYGTKIVVSDCIDDDLTLHIVSTENADVYGGYCLDGY